VCVCVSAPLCVCACLFGGGHQQVFMPHEQAQAVGAVRQSVSHEAGGGARGLLDIYSDPPSMHSPNRPTTYSSPTHTLRHTSTPRASEMLPTTPVQV